MAWWGRRRAVRRGKYYVAQEQFETDTELLKDKSKCPHIVAATPGRLHALVRDMVLGDMVGEVSCEKG